MSFKVKDPISKGHAHEQLALVGTKLALDHEIKIDEDEEFEAWKPSLKEFLPGTIVLASQIADRVDDFGLTQPYVVYRRQRVGIVVGRTYSEKLNRNGPYLILMRNGEQGYVQPSDMITVRLKHFWEEE